MVIRQVDNIPVSDFDRDARAIAVASIRRHSMNPEEWRYTVIGDLHTAIKPVLALARGELAITSAFISEVSWFAFTTRRVATLYGGEFREMDPRNGISHTVGNFKGLGAQHGLGAVPTEIATVSSMLEGASVRVEYETGKASMALLYACIFWERTTRFLCNHGENGT